MSELGFAPLRCVGCGTTAFDPAEDARYRTDAVMSRARCWLMDDKGEGAGTAYVACNACLDRKLGYLWADDGTLARVWYGDDPESA